jgi:hypothetical protein
MSEQSLNDILSKVKSNNTFKVYIPSLKTELDFKPLTLLQQKNIIDRISISGYGLVDFFVNVNEMLKANCVNNFNTLNTIDRVNIVVSYRRAINSIYQNVDLNKLLDKNKLITDLPTNTTITTDRFVFDVSVPTIIEDTKVNTFLINTYKDDRQLLGKLMVNELCKFINSITVTDSNTVVNLSTQSIKNRWVILEAIESSEFNKVFEFITKVRNTEEEFVKLENDKIDIGPELFVT